MAWDRFRPAGLGEHQSVGIHPVARRDCRDLPLQGRDDPDARSLFRGRHPALSGGARHAVNSRVAFVALIIGGVLVTAAADAQPRTIRVDIASMQPGTAPPGFEFTLTGGGPVSAWKVVADPTAAGQKAIAQTSTDRTDYRFPLAVYQPITTKNVEVTIRFKPVAGSVDQAGGIAVRLTDPDDYYVVRANA